MIRDDAFTNTETDAGRYAQAAEYQYDDRDHDFGPVAPGEHTCTTPNPKCLLCALDDAVREQKEAQRVIDEVNRERNAEWWAS